MRLSQRWCGRRRGHIAYGVGQRKCDAARVGGGLGGRYVLTGIPDGLIEVEVSGQGYIEMRKIATVRDGQDVTDFDF